MTGFRETSPGHYPWDDWQCIALAAGLSAELAALGRSLMREADQHCWCERLRRECGWDDEGRSLSERLLAQPRRTEARLQWLYASDGLRFDPWERREYDSDSPCWKRLRARWDRERAPPSHEHHPQATASGLRRHQSKRGPRKNHRQLWH